MTQRSPYLKAADRIANNEKPGLLSYIAAFIIVAILFMIIGAILGGLFWLNVEIWGRIF